MRIGELISYLTGKPTNNTEKIIEKDESAARKGCRSTNPERPKLSNHCAKDSAIE